MSPVSSVSPVSLTLTQASYRYPGGAAVGPVDLRVRGGEMVLLTGPTGCGKSTVLRLAAGLAQRHGQGTVGGRVDIFSLPARLRFVPCVSRPRAHRFRARASREAALGAGKLGDGTLPSLSSLPARLRFAPCVSRVRAHVFGGRPSSEAALGPGKLGGGALSSLGGVDPAALTPAERVAALGLVGQDPADWIVAGTLGDEVAFGLESAGWPADRIQARVVEVLARMGLPGDLSRSTRALSGGQRQRLVVGAALAGGARLLLLDEPLAHLDPIAARDLVRELAKLRDEGHAILLVEHRLEPVWDAVDRVVLMDDGAIVTDAPRDGFPLDRLRGLGLSVPGLVDLRDLLAATGRALPSPRPPPDVGEPRLEPGPIAPRSTASTEVRLTAGPLRWTWAAAGHGASTRSAADVALVDVAFSVRAGERVAVLGANGSGKSTLLSALAGRIAAGPVEALGRVVDVPQDPDLALFCATVGEELAHGPEEARLAPAAVEARVRSASAALSVQDLHDRPPQALSRGQRLRVAVAAALACDPGVLLLDEPTSGQDHDQVERMMGALRDAGTTLVFATHDVDLALRHATRVVLLHEGQTVGDGAPADVLDAIPPEVPLLVPPLARLCRELGLPPLTAAELVADPVMRPPDPYVRPVAPVAGSSASAAAHFLRPAAPVAGSSASAAQLPLAERAGSSGGGLEPAGPPPTDPFLRPAAPVAGSSASAAQLPEADRAGSSGGGLEPAGPPPTAPAGSAGSGGGGLEPAAPPPTAGIDPRVKLGLLACLGLAAVALERPLALGLVAAVAIVPLITLRVDRVWWRRGVLAVMALTWGTVLSQGLFYSMEPRTPLLVLGPLVVWREGLAYGLVQSLRFTALLVAGLGLVASTPVDRLMVALVRLRVPFGLAFLALTALRFVPEVAREIAIVRDARARRGRPAHHRPPWAWLRLEASLVRPVVARSLRRARSLAESLDARGFDPVAPRAERSPLSLRARDVALLGAGATIAGSVVGLRVIYVLYTADLVWVPQLRPVYALVRHWL